MILTFRGKPYRSKKFGTYIVFGIIDVGLEERTPDLGLNKLLDLADEVLKLLTVLMVLS